MVVLERSGTVESKVEVIVIVNWLILFFRLSEENLFSVELPLFTIWTSVRFDRPFFVFVAVLENHIHVVPTVVNDRARSEGIDYVISNDISIFVSE